MTATQTSVKESGQHTVAGLLDALRAGRGGAVAGLFASDAELDATVPGWRFATRGPSNIARQFASWFADAGEFEELRRQPTPAGEVVTYLLTWTERGMPFAAHHCHVLSLDEQSGKIVRDEFFCGGRWDAARLAEMAQARDAD